MKSPRAWIRAPDQAPEAELELVREGASAAGGRVAARPRPLALRRREAIGRFGGIAVFIGMVLFFSFARPDVFPTANNIRVILDETAPLLILGAGLTVVLLVGQFDLSFAATIGLAAGVAALLNAQHGWPAGVALVAGIAAGALVGLGNGIAVAYGKAPAFIVTLAAGSVVEGLDRYFTSDNPISGLSNGFLELTSRQIFTLTSATVAGVLIVAATRVLVTFTPYGAAVKAIGQNRTAAELAGLAVQRATLYAFVIMGACAGIVGVIVTSRAAQKFPNTGADLLLPPYAAAFFGAAVSGQGRFGPWSTLFGAIFIGTLTTGLTIMGAAAWLTVFIQGLVLLTAVLVTRRAL